MTEIAAPTTELEEVTPHLDAFRCCDRPDIGTHLSAALKRFRFIPRAERRACADDLYRWASDRPGDPLKRAYAVLVQSMDRFINEEYEASLQLLLQARTTFAGLGEREGLGLTAMLIGAIYRTYGNFDLALKALVEGFELLKASGRYPIFLAANANSMANIHLDLGNLDEAQAMFTVTREESERGDDFYFTIYALHGLGRVHMHRGEHDQAAAVFGGALALAERHRHPLMVSNSLTELATLHFQAGDLDAAQALSTRALAMREEHHLLGGAVTTCMRLAEIHFRREEWAAALPYLERALAIAGELRVKPKIAQVHQMLSELYERTGDPRRSLRHYQLFHALREQVEREDSARKVADARVIFEAEQTRRENAVIRAQKAEIERQNAELQETIDELTRAKIGRKAKAFTLGIAIVLFIFQDAILGTALRLLASDNYFLLLGVKMAIIFSLSPINRAIEHHLLRRVTRRGGRP